MKLRTEAGVTIAPIATLTYDPNGLIALAIEAQLGAAPWAVQKEKAR